MRQAINFRPDIAYARHDGAELMADLTMPKDAEGPAPLLITVPGGAWRQSNRRNHREWAEHIARWGIAVLTLQYRVAPPTTKAFPEALDDVIAGIRFGRDNAQSLKIDPERIGMLGTSAGAHLAALAALTSSNASPPLSSQLKLLVCVYGIYDLFAHWQKTLGDNPSETGNVTRNLLGTDPFHNQRAYFDASPIRHVTYAANKIPVLLSWGTNDDAVDPSQSEDFLRALQQARFDVRAHRCVGATHFWFN